MSSKQIRILHLVHMYYPSLGGMQIHMKELTESITSREEKFYIEVFATRAMNVGEFHQKEKRKNDLPERETINNVNVRRFNIWHRFYAFLIYSIPKIKGGYRLRKFILKDAVECLRMGPFVPGLFFGIICFRPDIVLLMNVYNSHAYFCFLAKKVHNFKLVIIPSLRMEPGWADHPMVEKVLKISDSIIALTEYEKKILIKKGLEEQKIKVMGVGVSTNYFAKGDARRGKHKFNIPSGFVVGFIARKTMGKGAEHVVDAMKIVWKKHADAILLFAGEDKKNHRKVIESHIDKLTCEEKSKIVEFGSYPETDRPDLFQAIDVFVMPSLIDSFGIVYLEAWSCKKPVIACKDRAPSTFIDHQKDGILVEYGNIDQIAEAINDLIDNPKKRIQMGYNGYKKVLSKYSWENISKQTIAVYRALNSDCKSSQKI